MSFISLCVVSLCVVSLCVVSLCVVSLCVVMPSVVAPEEEDTTFLISCFEGKKVFVNVKIYPFLLHLV